MKWMKLCVLPGDRKKDPCAQYSPKTGRITLFIDVLKADYPCHLKRMILVCLAHELVHWVQDITVGLPEKKTLNPIEIIEEEYWPHKIDSFLCHYLGVPHKSIAETLELYARNHIRYLLSINGYNNSEIMWTK